MAKTLKDFLNERQLGPMVVKNPDEQKFIDKHVVAKTADRNGNDDELFKGSKVKMADRKKDRKGYNPGEDEDVYEELKGNQHKIDANKNGKVDAHDFHLLRKKKKVAEEAEDLDEAALKQAEDRHFEKQSPKMQAAINLHLRKGKDYQDAVAAARRHVKEEVEELEELSKGKLTDYRTAAKKQGTDIQNKMKMGGGDWSKDGSDTKTLSKRMAGYKMAGRKTNPDLAASVGKGVKVPANEEVEVIDELSTDTMNNYARERSRTAFSGGRKPGESVDAGIKRKSRQINSLALSKTKINRARDTGSTVLSKEEVEAIDELSKKTLGSYVNKANFDSGSQGMSAGEMFAGGKAPRAQMNRMRKRATGVERAVDRLTKEEAELQEKLDMKKASMGTVVKDFQKSDAPQFMGKSQKKRQVMAIAAKLSARDGKPLNKEERLLTKLADISETHQRTMVSVFEKLNEDNQYAFMQACDTADGIEQMLDFSISYRGE